MSDGQNEAKELKAMTERLAKWLYENQAAKTGTPEYREALLLHRQATDLLARTVAASQ